MCLRADWKWQNKLLIDVKPLIEIIQNKNTKEKRKKLN